MYREWMKSNGSRSGHSASTSSTSNATFGGILYDQFLSNTVYNAWSFIAIQDTPVWLDGAEIIAQNLEQSAHCAGRSRHQTYQFYRREFVR